MTDRELMQQALNYMESVGQMDMHPEEWAIAVALRERLARQEPHPDDVAVDRFAAAMKAKMAKQRAKGYGGWQCRDECPAEILQERLVKHVSKGDPVDVGNFAMMLWNRGERSAWPARQEQEPEPVAWTPVADAMPKPGMTVLACYKNRLGNVRRIRAHWTATKTEESDPDCDFGEYDEEADIYWTPEGWYECIDNWDEYSSVAVSEGTVTHWMPLPPDPYTAPQRREWVGLTDGEAMQIIDTARHGSTSGFGFMRVARTIEAALKEKNA